LVNDMVRKCPHCGREQTADNYNCDLCKEELLDNGELIDALTFWDRKKPSTIKQIIIPLIIITVAGILSAALDTYLILFIGMALAAIYYYRLVNSKVKS
jgi:uncharacterized membrane protein YvbJ